MIAPSFASAALITQGAALDVSLLYYQPVPAQPGDVLDVYIQIENDGGKASKQATLTILESGPFTLENPTQRVKEVPSIPGQETFLTNARIRVSRDANEGDNTLRIRVQENGDANYIERDLSITITGTSSSLSVQSAATEPQEILPGEQATLTIVVKNIGNTEVRNVDVALDLDDLSFAPVGSSDSKTISQLKGGAEHTFTFNLVSYPDTAPKAYQIPLTLSYDDETGNAKTQEETVGMIVGTTPQLRVYFDSVALTKESPSGEVVIRFVNRGLAEIKLLEMEVLESEDVHVTSETPVIYVGNIDEDDYESAEISLKTTAGVTSVPIHVRYKDALNREYEETYDLPLRLQSSKDNGSGSTWVPIVIVLVVIGLIVWWWRSRRTKRKK